MFHYFKNHKGLEKNPLQVIHFVIILPYLESCNKILQTVLLVYLYVLEKKTWENNKPFNNLRLFLVRRGPERRWSYFNVIGKTIIHFSTTVNVGILDWYSRKLKMFRNAENLKTFWFLIFFAIKIVKFVNEYMIKIRHIAFMTLPFNNNLFACIQC